MAWSARGMGDRVGRVQLDPLALARRRRPAPSPRERRGRRRSRRPAPPMIGGGGHHPAGAPPAPGPTRRRPDRSCPACRSSRPGRGCRSCARPARRWRSGAGTAADQRLVLGQGCQAAAQIAGRRHAEVTPQPAGAAAVIGGGDHRGDVAMRLRPRRIMLSPVPPPRHDHRVLPATPRGCRFERAGLLGNRDPWPRLSSRLVQRLVDLPGDLGRQPGDGFEFVTGG